MATPNSFSVSNSNGRFTLTLSLTESTNISTNKSTIGYTLTLKANTSWHFNGYLIGRTVSINGVTVYNVARADSSSYDLAGYSSITLASGTTEVTHNADGTKSCAVSFSINMTSADHTPGNLSSSGTATLTNIPRYATITSQSATVISETSIQLSWLTDAVCDYMWYSTNNGSTWTGYDMADGNNGSVVITGLSPNTSYNCKIKVRRKDSQLTSESTTLSSKTYNYPFCTHSYDFLIGDAVTLALYNPLNRTVTVSIVDTAHNIVHAYGATSGISITLTPNASTLYGTIPNNRSAFYHVKVECSATGSTTYNIDNKKYSIKEEECQPTFGELAYIDGNPLTLIVGGIGKIIQNTSPLVGIASPATAKNGATITGYSFNVGTKTVAGVYEEVEGEQRYLGAIGTINSSVDVTLYCTATDSRGFTCSSSITVNMIPYTPPSAVVSVKRVNNYETSTSLLINATATDINNRNNATIKYSYEGGTEYTRNFKGSVTVNQPYSLDQNTEYKFIVTITDTVGGTPFSGTYILPKGKFTLFIDVNMNAVGINDFPQSGEALRVKGKTVVDGDIQSNNTPSLRNQNEITSGDFNNYKTPGSYIVRSNSYTETISNCPSNKAGTLTVYEIAGNKYSDESVYCYIKQEYIDLNNITYSRIIQSGETSGQWTYGSWTNLIGIMCDKIYPVGSVYISFNSTSPATLFGGTWEQIKDTFLLAVGGSHSIGESGGSEEVTLGINQIPAHDGHMYSNFDGNAFADRGGEKDNSYMLASTNDMANVENRPWKVEYGNEVVMQGYTRGGGAAHNNMPPYMTVYMWKRTA